MNLLLVGIALLVAWLFGRHLHDPKHRAMHAWFKALLPRLTFSLWPWLVALIPGLIVGVLHYYLLNDGRLVWAATVSLGALIFSWGSRDLDSDVGAYLEAESDEARADAAATLTFDYRQPTECEAVSSVVEGVFYQALVRWFGTLLWFLLAGPGGALAFRFSQSLLCEVSNRHLLTPPQLDQAKRWVALLDWPAALMASLALAVVGDFDRVFGGARRFLADSSWLTIDRDLWPRLGRLTVQKGHTLDDAFAHDFSGDLGQVNAAMSLVWRVLVCWLTVSALIYLAPYL